MEQAQIAEEAGAVAVMALECQLTFRQKGVARMSDHGLIKEIKKAITIPVMAKARIDSSNYNVFTNSNLGGHWCGL